MLLDCSLAHMHDSHPPPPVRPEALEGSAFGRGALPEYQLLVGFLLAIDDGLKESFGFFFQ
jgi:hypothetical protein